MASIINLLGRESVLELGATNFKEWLPLVSNWA